MRYTIATAALALSCSAAAAATFGAPTVDPAFLASLDRVCAVTATVTMTQPAHVACLTQAFPALNADGKSFANRGIGAEFNSLMRNLPAETATVTVPSK